MNCYFKYIMTAGTPAQSGLAIPMATDIAFPYSPGRHETCVILDICPDQEE